MRESTDDQQFFDDMYRDDGFEAWHRRERRFFDAYLRKVDRAYVSLDGAGKTALEIGCGCGGVSSLLADRGYRVHAVDLSEYAIQHLRRVEIGEVCCADIEQGLPWDDVYDLVVGFEVIEHLRKPEVVLKEIRSRLAPGGAFVASTPFPGTAVADAPGHVSVHRPEEWGAMLGRAGFARVKTMPIRYLPYIYRFHPRLGRIFRSPARLSWTVLIVAQ